MRVFITGATGAVGRPTVEALRAAGHEVSGVARTPDKAEQLRALGATPVEVDLFDRDAVKTALAGHDAVANLATAIPPTSKAWRAGAWEANERIRREVSANVVAGALDHGIGRLVQESIAFSYAGDHDGPIGESEPLAPAPLFEAILESEGNARWFGDDGGTAVVLRLGNFYGPHSASTVDWVKMVRRRLTPIPGPPDGYWPLIHHDDAAAAVGAALDVAGGTYHVVDDEPLTRAEIGAVIAGAIGVKQPRPTPRVVRAMVGRKAPTLLRSFEVRNDKLRGASGWAPTYRSLRDGVEPTLTALRDRGDI